MGPEMVRNTATYTILYQIDITVIYSINLSNSILLTNRNFTPYSYYHYKNCFENGISK